MANQWLRLWHELPTDPKWRTIAKASGQSIGNVISVYVHLLVCASNASERGRTQSFNAEDVATALDIELSQVDQIIQAMQGRVLDGDLVSAWAKRQVAREDGSAERSRAWRESKKAETERTPNATERNRAPDKDKDKEEIKSNTRERRATRLPDPMELPDEWSIWAKQERPDLDPENTWAKFSDYWRGKPGRAGTKLDWLATWRNWVREERGKPMQRTGQTENTHKYAAAAATIYEGFNP